MGLFPSFEKLGSVKDPSNNIKPTLFHSIEYEVSGILRKIQNINDIDDSEIRDIITRQHAMILNYDLFLENPEKRRQAQILFTNKRFLHCFLDIIGTLKLSNHEKICLNKLAYDYYIFPNRDQEISELLFSLTVWTNTKEVASISAILGINGARILAMIKNSSFKEEKCIHRVNTFIIKCNIALTVQNVIDIYCGLFDRFTNPFIFTMMESKPNNLSPDESNRFDAISMAMVYILDSLTSYDIRKVIYDYGYMISMLRQHKQLRFSLKSLMGYPRIISIVREIEMGENIIIP